MMCNKSVWRFRTPSRQDRREWFTVLKQEITASIESQDDPVHVIHSLMRPVRPLRPPPLCARSPQSLPELA